MWEGGVVRRAAVLEEFGAPRNISCQVNLMTMSKVFIIKEILLSCSVSMCVCELFEVSYVRVYVLLKQCDCFF